MVRMPVLLIKRVEVKDVNEDKEAGDGEDK
jgi:hypothetical protein